MFKNILHWLYIEFIGNDKLSKEIVLYRRIEHLDESYPTPRKHKLVKREKR